MSPTRSPDFARRADDYDRVRPIDDNWREIYEVIVREADLRGRSVLDCGCGTGRLSATLARDGAEVWGVDVEPRMLDVARRTLPPEVALVEGRAEELPFGDRAFDRVVMWLVCHLVDRPMAFREAHRVLGAGGRLVVVTFDETHFDRFWLSAYFPSLEASDRARFPTRQQLEAELGAAGFPGITTLRRSQHSSLTRAQALDRIEADHISTFDLLDSEEVVAGRARARKELAPMVNYELEWLIAIAER